MGAAAETHLYQTSPPPINTRECGAEELVCTVEAVIRCTAEQLHPSITYALLKVDAINIDVYVFILPLRVPSPSTLHLSLLKEAEIHAEQREFELNRRRQMGLSSSHHSLDNIEFDNKEDDQHDQRLLSQFGIWFLVGNHRRLPRLTGDKTVHVCAQSYLC